MSDSESELRARINDLKDEYIQEELVRNKGLVGESTVRAIANLRAELAFSIVRGNPIGLTPEDLWRKEWEED
jgi:hypothetical protein